MSIKIIKRIFWTVSTFDYYMSMPLLLLMCCSRYCSKHFYRIPALDFLLLYLCMSQFLELTIKLIETIKDNDAHLVSILFTNTHVSINHNKTRQTSALYICEVNSFGMVSLSTSIFRAKASAMTSYD